jgi:hypothetical protein
MQARRQRATAWWWALPPAIAVTILFLPALLGERLHFYEDLATGTYPMRVYLAESLRNGELPLWCPLVFCGYPLMAEGQMGTLYPPNALLFLALPGPAAQEVSLLLHYLLGIFGMFVFLGTLRLSAPARWVLSPLH